MVLDAYRNGIRLLGYIDGWRAAPAPHLIGEYDALQVSPPIIMDWRPIPLDTKGYSLVYRFRELQIWRNPNEFPAAFLLPARRLSDPTPVAADEVIPLAPVGGSGINARVLEVEANEHSLAVVTESWFEGWTATVDGQPADLVSVSNYLAVRVPPGQHSIRFEYTPWSFPIGLAISGISWLLVAAIGAKSLLGRRTFRASAWRAA